MPAKAYLPCPKPPSRLDDRRAEKRLAVIDERAFKADVWLRDHACCRWCGRRVTKTIEHIAERGEIHHLHGRLGDLRFESKCALLLCLEDHELVTGKVNTRWIVEGTKHWSLNGQIVIDARKPVRFVRIA